MTTRTLRRTILGFAVLAVFAAATPAQADIITFDGTLTPGLIPPDIDPAGLADTYFTNRPPAQPQAFSTQGFVFGGATGGVTPGNTTPDFNHIRNSALCLSMIGKACVSNGTKYIVVGEPFNFGRQAGG